MWCTVAQIRECLELTVIIPHSAQSLQSVTPLEWVGRCGGTMNILACLLACLFVGLFSFLISYSRIFLLIELFSHFIILLFNLFIFLCRVSPVPLQSTAKLMQVRRHPQSKTLRCSSISDLYERPTCLLWS
jgi:hypothetical protein